MRNTQKGPSLNSPAEKENIPIKIVQLDVTDDDSINTAVKTIYNKDGRIDVLINNYG
jgi:NADP-dependent 3-hydroxy acid dehydrogenase YdfG